jgi:hypothetical protein
MKRDGRSPGTIENYRDYTERLFEDWLDKPLPGWVVSRHWSWSAMTRSRRKMARYVASGSMRSLRAVYNHALAQRACCCGRSAKRIPSLHGLASTSPSPDALKTGGMVMVAL